MSNVHKLYETNRLQFAFRLHYLLFIVFIHMHTSSVANYALDVHYRKRIKQTTPNTVSPIPVKPVVLICRRLFAIGRKQRQDLYLFILFHILQS